MTNKIYVANIGTDNVTVINGGDHSAMTVAAGLGPNGIALNPVTNKIYVTNRSSSNVTVIDGITDCQCRPGWLSSQRRRGQSGDE